MFAADSCGFHICWAYFVPQGWKPESRAICGERHTFTSCKACRHQLRQHSDTPATAQGCSPLPPFQGQFLLGPATALSIPVGQSEAPHLQPGSRLQHPTPSWWEMPTLLSLHSPTQPTQPLNQQPKFCASGCSDSTLGRRGGKHHEIKASQNLPVS